MVATMEKWKLENDKVLNSMVISVFILKRREWNWTT